MTDKRLVDITYDSTPERLDEPSPAADLSLPRAATSRVRSLDRTGRNRLLEYGVLASIVLHVIAFAVVPRLSTFQQDTLPPKPEKPITPVVLRDPPPEPAKDEPPPEDSSAISDRNHTAEKERKPEVIPTPETGPISRNQTSQQPKRSNHQANKDNAKRKRNPRPQPPIALPNTENIKKWNVDLRPTARDLKYALAPRGSGKSRDFFPDGDQEEVAVDMNTREDRFYSYMQGVQRKIDSAWGYPPSAGRAGIGGTVTLQIVIAKDGKLKSLTLLKSSGHAILDQTALAAIKDAAPYNPFPARVKARRLRIRANFSYVSEGFFKRILR